MILAGDSAHLTPPFAGQGMCAGIRDSKNLAWKLDLSLSGKTDDTILDTYTKERNPHNREVVESALFLGKVICVTDPEAAAQRDEMFFTGQVPPFPEFPYLTDGLLAHQGSYTGKLSFQSRVSYQGKTGLFDDIVGDDWIIMSPVEDPKKVLTEEQIAFLDSIGAKFIKISQFSDSNSDNQVIDVDGKYQQYFNETGLEAVIARPDYYLFGAVSNLAELPTLVESLTEQLGQYMKSITVG